MVCPYLKSLQNGGWFSYSDYICEVTGQKMDGDSTKVRETCSESKHDNCPYYKRGK